MARGGWVAYYGSMENFLVDKRPMGPKDWAFDAAIAAVAFGFGCMQMVLATSSVIMPDETLRRLLGIEAIVPTTAAYVALALTVFPLVLRRRFAWPVFVFTSIAFLGLQSLFHGYTLPIVGPLIALFTIASERSRAEACVAGALALAGVLFTVGPPQSVTMAFLTRFQNAALMAAGALAGYAFRTHREYVRATEQRALEAERTREEVAARRVEEERVRIAREVHDITAHSLSAVSIQAAAAERLVERDPQAAKEAIATARRTAKEALDEIRGMIGVLRSREGAAETEPAKGTNRLEDLATYLREAGVEPQVDVAAYDRARVPAYVDMALYDIAREATTNIVRHAQARTAVIRLAREGACVRMVVEDDGVGAAAAGAQAAGAAAGSQVVAAAGAQVAAAAAADGGDGGRPASAAAGGAAGVPVAAAGAQAGGPAGGGHGIEGMAERAHLLGGTLEAAPRFGGGFRVAVSLPLPERGKEQ